MSSLLPFCFQVYNEIIRDLLNPSTGYLELREDSKGCIQIAGITEVSTTNAQEVSITNLRQYTGNVQGVRQYTGIKPVAKNLSL